MSEVSIVSLPPVGMASRALTARWLEEFVALHRAGRTKETYEDLVRLHLKPGLGKVKLVGLLAGDLQPYFDRMIRADAPTTTVARHRTTLGSALTWARKTKGWIEKNPMVGLSTPISRPGVGSANPRQRPPDIDIPNGDEVRTLLDKTRDDPLWAAWVVLATLGLRPSELIALGEDELLIGPGGNVSIVAIHRKTYLARERDADGNRLRIVEDPKWASYREFEAPATTLRVLLDQARKMRAERAAHPRWPKQWTGWLFLRSDGTPLDRRTIHERLGAACRAAGVGPWPPVALRHYCASQLLEAGMSTIAVGKWLGHRSGAMVEHTYGHVLRRVRGADSPGAIMDRTLGEMASKVASTAYAGLMNRGG
jgi:integrase